MPNYTLVDAEADAIRNPDISIRKFDSKDKIPYKAFVKLQFIIEPDSPNPIKEFLWVQVYAQEEGTDIYYGGVSSISRKQKIIRLNDDIQFEIKNVYECMEPL